MEIRESIQQLLSRRAPFKVTDVQALLSKPISRQYVSRLLNDLVDQGVLKRIGRTRGASYVVSIEQAELFLGKKKRLRNKRLEEHIVFEELQRNWSYFQQLPEHIRSNFEYGFTEIFNNAIEHSQSHYVEVRVGKSIELISFAINDFGVGIFRNVMKKRQLKSELEAIQDLLKGKTTTDPKSHTGEGVFFTSKVADVLLVQSYDYRLRVDNELNDVFVEKSEQVKKGTKVTFLLRLDSKRHLSDVFRKYQTNLQELAFDKTDIQVKLYTLGTVYISRSHARRILSGLEQFRSVRLDFDRVNTVGQAFADEIFRVFRSQHPEITITPVHMNEPVTFMVKRAQQAI